MADGTCLHVLTGHPHTVLGVAWGAGDRHVVSCSNDGSLRVWDAMAAAGGDARAVVEKARAYKGVCVDPADPRVVLSCGDDKAVVEWTAKGAAA